MKVFESLNEGFDVPYPVVTIGTFDGVHVGHQKIIQRLNEEARLEGGESTLFTFYPHPRLVLNPDQKDLKLLQTKEEKSEKLERMGLQNMILYPFTIDFSKLTAIEFVRDILVEKMKVRKLVIGYDHQFGNNREGGLEFLQSVSSKYGFEVIEIPAEDINDVNVSSSKIRKALMQGEVETANQYLSEPYEMNGLVVKGNALGRQMEFPTANLDLETNLKLIPKQGVYAVQVVLQDSSEWMGMMNIGTKPTLGEDAPVSLEVHLLNFEGDLYDQRIKVRFLRFLREEQRFDNLNSLKSQLKQDALSTRDYFNSLV